MFCLTVLTLSLAACDIENLQSSLDKAPAEDDTACVPSAERCDELDNDCDGVVDNNATDMDTWYEDFDGDTFGATPITACEKPPGTVNNAEDCDDSNPNISPGAAEICNEMDDDCDAWIDEEDPSLSDGITLYADADGDTYGDPAAAFVTCDPLSGTANYGDCDDSDGEIHPSAEEICDEIDNDCDGTLDADDCECGGDAGTGLRVTITNSRNYNSGQAMDLIWEGVATDMGFVPTIISRSTLDDAGALATTDLLVLSSGVDTYTADETAAVRTFIEDGGSVYFQTEYTCTYSANASFARIVSDLGASFRWMGTVSGDLGPLPATGCLTEFPQTFAGFDYFWYGCEGDGIPEFVTSGGKKIAFQYCPTDASMGQIITTTDQDWLNQAGSFPEHKKLLTNILAAMATTPASCP